MHADDAEGDDLSSPDTTADRQATDVDAEEGAANVARDASLVARAQRGDSTAFDALITPLLPRALRLARRLLNDEQDAEDLVQDTCLRALDRIEQHDQQRAFGPWFMRMLVNLGLNQQKSRKVRRHQELSDFTPSNVAAPDRLAEDAETQERFTKAVGALSERQRQIVMLHEVEGWTTTDISQELGLSPQTVRWHLHDARHTLREALDVLRDRSRGATSEKR